VGQAGNWRRSCGGRGRNRRWHLTDLAYPPRFNSPDRHPPALTLRALHAPGKLVEPKVKSHELRHDGPSSRTSATVIAAVAVAALGWAYDRTTSLEHQET